MEFDLVKHIEQCVVLVRESVPISLVYYTHIPASVLSLVVSIFVMVKTRFSLGSKALFGIASTFSLWAGFNIVLWTSADSRMYMFFWNFMVLFEALFFIFSLYLVYVFIDKRDVSLKIKLIWGLFLVPILYAINSRTYLEYFSAIDCVPVEGSFYQIYALPLYALIFFWILAVGVTRYKKASVSMRKQIVVLLAGILSLLVFFFSGEAVANYLIANGMSPTRAYGLEFIGLLGMPIFIILLSYLIVRYQAFNIKLLGAQAIMVGLVILIASQFAFIQNPTNRILTAITLAFSVFFGWQLVLSVKNEVAQKEELVRMNERLRRIDQSKSEFISIASHQLRTPLTVIKGYISMMNEGTFGVLPPGLKDALGKVYISNERLIKLVEELLNVSRIESGKLRYVFESRQLLDLVSSICNELKGHAAAKGLKFELIRPEVDLPPVMMDEEKMRQVIMNLIDNAIKYTNKGSVTIALKKQDERILFSVSDSGVGIKPDDMQNLFKKFSRGTGTSLIHTEGTGLGLYVARQITEAHGGKAWAESAGEGQGSRFYFYLPILKEGGNNN